MNKKVAMLIFISFFTLVAQAQKKKNFSPKTKMDYVLFAVSAIEHDSDFVTALNWINQAIVLDSNNSFYYAVRGNINLFQKNYRLAGRDFERAVSLDPNIFSNFLGRAKCWYFLGDYKKSLVDLDRAIGLESFDADVYLWRSKVRKKLGDEPGAESDWKIYDYMNRP